MASPFQIGLKAGLREAAAKAREAADRLERDALLTLEGHRFQQGAVEALRAFAEGIEPKPRKGAAS